MSKVHPVATGNHAYRLEIASLRAEIERQAARMKALDEENERLKAESALWESRTKDGAEIIMGNVKEIERLKEICRDISDVINTDPHLYQEPIDYPHVLRKIEDLAVSGYAPETK